MTGWTSKIDNRKFQFAHHWLECSVITRPFENKLKGEEGGEMYNVPIYLWRKIYEVK